jgi:outer membrane usher protein
MRHGATDTLTLEAHAEATGDLVDAGGGAVVRLDLGGVQTSLDRQPAVQGFR